MTKTYIVSPPKPVGNMIEVHVEGLPPGRDTTLTDDINKVEDAARSLIEEVTGETDFILQF